MEKIKIGRIVNAVALKGEVKVYNYSGYRERYEELERILTMMASMRSKRSDISSRP